MQRNPNRQGSDFSAYRQGRPILEHRVGWASLDGLRGFGQSAAGWQILDQHEQRLNLWRHPVQVLVRLAVGVHQGFGQIVPE